MPSDLTRSKSAAVPNSGWVDGVVYLSGGYAVPLCYLRLVDESCGARGPVTNYRDAHCINIELEVCRCPERAITRMRQRSTRIAVGKMKPISMTPRFGIHGASHC